MTTFISYGMSGRLAASPTLDAAKAVPTCNVIVETDDQFSPRPLTAAWVSVASANRAPWWQSADPTQTAVRIAQNSLAL